MLKTADSRAATHCLCEAVLIFGICLHRFDPAPGAVPCNCDSRHVENLAIARPLLGSAIETFASGERWAARDEVARMAIATRDG